ncbi:homocysteine-responsive endoplasmic reticulum-resident ubiquitin-like domain member 2 protein isoform X4 [Ambystoma mexicanum]|uniref:homocysteine-responsive endoplasmic reticulum-resident ubiquitin-like domain member 2 protein isoform X4 n=1 Tax=Ambystoma mexicanum TaxID=8296 RepID=UPI0037E94814
MDTSFIDSPVRLVIKAPSQKYDDQTIDCFLDWTVENLKHHLSKVYPSKPSLKDQRLVYSGKLLLDHLRLKDVLRKQDEYHMVHLVCSTLTPPSSPKSNSSTELVGTSSDLSSSNVEYLGSTTASTSATLNTASEVFRARNHPPVQPSNVQNPAAFYFTQGSGSRQFSQHGTPVGLPQYPAIHPVHLLWWQHMYARQSYLQYHAAAISALSASNHQQASPVPPSRVQSEVVIQNEQAAAPNLAPQENRHQARWFPFRQNGDPRPAANQDANLNNDLQNERLMDDGLDDEGGEDAAEETRPEQQPGLLTSAWTFITAFFISLIPEGPPPAQN